MWTLLDIIQRCAFRVVRLLLLSEEIVLFFISLINVTTTDDTGSNLQGIGFKNNI